MQYYKPAEIAAALGISTSALRHYESRGAVPAPERAANGYRLFTELHLAYFRCLRAMNPGFGYKVTYDVLRCIQRADMDQALWLAGAEQAKLQEEKAAADQTLILLQDPGINIIKGKPVNPRMTIGEAAEIAGVKPSAIRHWEKEGLLTPLRNPENGYRIYTAVHLRQILLIRTLRRTVYFLERMKELVEAVEQHSLEKAKVVAEHALDRINQRNRQQYSGVHQLVELCFKAGLMGPEDTAAPSMSTYQGVKDKMDNPTPV
ncbi:TioE family transcriptional regulator [Paenibacillus sp. S150]|uniref:TioE family transcriptional regulator n=1 Tax=Paenibacillus sp. S150 TaxID=2749826 RepID=UPI001C59C47C|nr:TioE family transcriptional regulator [Paenibacillus sp. S150]MBW4084476.1 MerR family DNA-binding transcriptional regulator [Paenibacillus sp. S150]